MCCPSALHSKKKRTTISIGSDGAKFFFCCRNAPVLRPPPKVLLINSHRRYSGLFSSHPACLPRLFGSVHRASCAVLSRLSPDLVVQVASLSCRVAKSSWNTVKRVSRAKVHATFSCSMPPHWRAQIRLLSLSLYHGHSAHRSCVAFIVRTLHTLTSVNGRTKVISTHNMPATQIMPKMQLILDSSGSKTHRLKRTPVASTSESARGIWSPMHDDPTQH